MEKNTSPENNKIDIKTNSQIEEIEKKNEKISTNSSIWCIYGSVVVFIGLIFLIPTFGISFIIIILGIFMILFSCLYCVTNYDFNDYEKTETNENVSNEQNIINNV